MIKNRIKKLVVLFIILIFDKFNMKMKIIKMHLKKDFLNIQELQSFKMENNFLNK